MLAVTGELPTGPDWAYELKWDGVRALAVVRDATVRLHARSGADITATYPELAGLATVATEAVLDGEIIVLDDAGRPSFAQLAERMQVQDAAQAARLAQQLPATYLIFDLLSLLGQDISDYQYMHRRMLLEQAVPPGDRWLVSPRFADGPATVAAATEHALEGVVAKRLDSRYRPGVRSPDWVKVKRERTGDFVVGGWRPGERELGALLVGEPVPGGLVFRGRVGGGISGTTERPLLAALAPLRTERSPFVPPVGQEETRGTVWVRPELVVEVRYAQRTRDGKLRFPRFLRMRPDKRAEEAADDA